MERLTKAQALALIDGNRPLFAAAADVNPFASAEWLGHYIEQIARPEDTFLAARMPGAALLLQSGARGEAAAVANYYTSLYSPVIAAEGARAAAADALAGDLAASRPRVAALRLAPLQADAPETDALAKSLAARGWYVKRYFCFGNWHMQCAGLTMEAYVKQLPSQTRNTLQRKGKRFREQGGRLVIHSSPAEVTTAIDAYDAIYGRSWKQPEPYPGFVPGWARVCADNGWLRLGVAWMGDTPVAAQFWFTRNDRAFIFKLAYDEAQATWSAGTLLTGELMRHSLEVDRVVEIDYLTGDDAYKQAWMRQRRERIGLYACNLRTARGLVLAAAERGRDIVRPWLRRKPAAPARPQSSVPPTAASPSGS